MIWRRVQKELHPYSSAPGASTGPGIMRRARESLKHWAFAFTQRKVSCTALLCIFWGHIISIILFITAILMKDNPARLVVGQSRVVGFFLVSIKKVYSAWSHLHAAVRPPSPFVTNSFSLQWLHCAPRSGVSSNIKSQSNSMRVSRSPSETMQHPFLKGRNGNVLMGH